MHWVSLRIMKRRLKLKVLMEKERAIELAVKFLREKGRAIPEFPEARQPPSDDTVWSVSFPAPAHPLVSVTDGCELILFVDVQTEKVMSVEEYFLSRDTSE